jgi:diguanylate cyclase (GGDEF)-like protein
VNDVATLLIVEEGPINRHFLVTLLREHGHRVLEASSGEEALALVRGDQMDLMIIDVLMSNTDTCGLVAELPSLPDLVQPRILFRASMHIETEARALAAAFRAPLVPKPCYPSVLLTAVDTVLAEPRPNADAPRPEQRVVDLLLRAILRRLSHYTMNLERLNVQMDRQVVEHNAQLDQARAAMEQEIRKRLWTEHELTQVSVSLRDQAVRDELTGLHNRRYLEETLTREESRARRRGEPLGLMLIDIDGFKKYNDTLGHAAGDEVLRTMGRYMSAAARREDIVCRYGGDEFVFVMNRASQATVWERAEKLRHEVKDLAVEYDGRAVEPVSVSIGIAIFPQHGENAQVVLRVADAALYRAKELGRDCVILGGGESAWLKVET